MPEGRKGDKVAKRRKHWARQAGIFPSPVYGGRCPEGGRGDKVAKRRKCWVRQAGIFPFPRLRGKVPEGRKGEIKLPSGVNAGLVKRVVTGFRRDVACNVSKTKNRIAPRNVVLTQNAKSRLRPLGGLKPALCPPSGINTGLVKRRKRWARQAGIFPSPVYRGKCPKGGREDKVARRRQCWARQAGIFPSPFTGEGARRAEWG